MTGEIKAATTSDALKWPHLVCLRPNLYVAAFTTMKLIPAVHIIKNAEANGLITKNTVVVETTSGTFGLALAMVCAERGHKLILVGDSAIDSTLKNRIESLGADLRIVTEPASVGGIQQARLNLVASLREEREATFWPAQYENPANPAAYGELADWLVRRLGNIDCLIGTVGTGGSMCGTGAALKQIIPTIQIVGVDTHGSVLFGQDDRPGRLLRGLGNSIMPPNVNHSVFDDIHWVSAPVAFSATHQLHRDHALFMGPTSGASWIVADWWARNNPKSLTVAILPDDGHRYQGTVYNSAWLADKHIDLGAPPQFPLKTHSPKNQTADWTYFQWGRKSYMEVMNGTT